MRFQFSVNLTDQDYLDYNVFTLIKSPYGKKQVMSVRIFFAVLGGVLSLITFWGGDFSLETFIGSIPMVIIVLAVILLWPRFLAWSIKCQVKAVRKNGKMAYSPQSVIEFYDDYFVETTPDNKTEQKYLSIERISIVDSKIYIHVNSVMSYILPLSCFESKEQYSAFLDFVKTKCTTIDIY